MIPVSGIFYVPAKKTSPPSAREAAMRSMQNKITQQNFIKHFLIILETLFEILLKHT